MRLRIEHQLICHPRDSHTCYHSQLSVHTCPHVPVSSVGCGLPDPVIHHDQLLRFERQWLHGPLPQRHRILGPLHPCGVPASGEPEHTMERDGTGGYDYQPLLVAERAGLRDGAVLPLGEWRRVVGGHLRP